MNTSPEFNLILRDRAQLFEKARAFFKERHVLEVDCPALSQAAPVDLHIEVMTVNVQNQTGYLHTSPEYGMKRLLAQGSGDIYQISHVFRDEEIGPWHNPEFTMAEWYRVGFTFEQMIEETLDFIRLFLGPLPSECLTYRTLLLTYLDIDYLTATPLTLYHAALKHGLDLPELAQTWEKDTLLQLLIGLLIEPKLQNEELTVVTHFPASQAALSKITTLEQESVGLRFEVYYKGAELANGYEELTDSIEQEARFKRTNATRKEAGKKELKIDRHFLEALKRGIPDCCGVAVGFDRLVQLKHRQNNIANAIPFVWDIA